MKRVVWIIPAVLFVGAMFWLVRRVPDKPKLAPALVVRDAQAPASRVIEDFDTHFKDTRIHANTAEPLGAGRYAIGGLSIEALKNGQVDATIEAPQSVLDETARLASSDGPLTLKTTDGRLTLQGRGWTWFLEDNRLVISNDVRTTVLREFTHEAPTTKTNRLIHITSQRLDYRPERAIFSGEVQARETEGSLDCARLAIHFTSGERTRLDRLEAEGSVTLAQGAMRARADRGTYRVRENEVVVDLQGNASWSDGRRSGSADHIQLDQERRVLTAEGRTRTRLPDDSFGAEGFLLPPSPAPAPGPDRNERFIDLSADKLVATLPPTNGPIRRLEALGSVVLESAADKTRATGGRLVYDEQQLEIELTLDPALESEGRTARADVLTFDRNHRVLRGAGQAYLRLPVASLSGTTLIPGPAANAAAGADGYFLEVRARTFGYAENQLEFEGGTKTLLRRDERKTAELHSEKLVVRFSNRIESVACTGGVEGWFFPEPQPGQATQTAQLKARSLLARMDANGQPESLSLDGGVVLDRTEMPISGATPLLTRLRSERMRATFATGTGRVADAVAEQEVILEQGERRATGEQARYDGGTQTVHLTGSPTAAGPEGRIENARELIWRVALQEWSATGRYRIHVSNATGRDSDPASLLRLPRSSSSN